MAIVRGNADKALAAYGRALSIKPDHAPAQIARASPLVDLGRTDAATSDAMLVAKERS
jgi:hypothetical protein